MLVGPDPSKHVYNVNCGTNTETAFSEFSVIVVFRNIVILDLLYMHFTFRLLNKEDVNTKNTIMFLHHLC